MKNFFQQKLKAFLHDPIDKIFNIKNHESRAVEYSKIFIEKENLYDDIVKKSDHISAAADRVHFSQTVKEEQIIINFSKDAEISHPLGCNRISLGHIIADYSNIKESITNCFQSIKKRSSNNEKKLLLDLWRNIPAELSHYETEKFKIGNLWDLLPADSRIPDHSILDHLWLSAAVCGSLPEPAFLKFSFGPVQSFISKARRTEDFWSGSYILSYLSSKAIEVIIDKAGPEHVIFPYLKNQPLIDKILKDKYLETIENINETALKIPSLPNIIFAVLPSEDVKDIAEEMKKNVIKAFKEISEAIKDGFKEFFNSDYISNFWSKQIEDFIEIYYVIFKWPKNIDELRQLCKKITSLELVESIQEHPQLNLGNYWQDMYKIVDILFISRKNLRNFNQFTISAQTLKCTLCGEREALHKEGETTNRELIKFWKEISQSKNSNYKIELDGREKLCAVCFTKRMFGEHFYKKHIKEESINYPSTSTIAALPFKEKVIKNLSNKQVFNMIKEYNSLLEELGIKENCGVFNWRSIKYLENLIEKCVGNNNEQNKEVDKFLSFDGQWLHKESFTKKNLENYGINFDKPKIDRILAIIGELQKMVDDSPSKYFAVIAMDGDDMGKWFSGTHKNWPKLKEVVHSTLEENCNEEVRRSLSPSIHSFISKCLGYYSLKIVRRVVEEENPCKLIYCGGDDLILLAPVEYALYVAQKLRFAFSGDLDENGEIILNENKTGFIILKNEQTKEIIPTLGKATMSAGIVIAHKDHNLADVFSRVSSAKEKAKKSNCDKDSFFIKILKRSGNITDFCSKWKTNNNVLVINSIKFILDNVAKKENKDGLSMSFFQSAFDELNKVDILDIKYSLLKRQLHRHYNLTKQENETNEEYEKRKFEIINKLETEIKNLFHNSNKNLLLVLRFLASGGRI